MAKRKAKQAGAEKFFHIVNPHGTVHVVSRAIATVQLARPGFRQARKPEIEAYESAHVQTADDPIAEPFEPLPADELELEDEADAKSE